MNFSANPTPTPQPKSFKPQVQQKWWDRFISQPHQLFFTSAIFFAIIVMLLTFISFIGKASIDFSLVHGFGLNYAVFTNAFLGFLITVMPKYNNSYIIEKEQYVKPWIIYQVGVLIALFIFPLVGKLIIAGVMFYFAKIFYTTIKKGGAFDKKDSIFINLVFILGATYLTIEAVFSLNLSLLVFFSYLICLVFLVAQRMVPAFYSSYMKVAQWTKPKYIREIAVVIFLSLGLSVQLESFLLMKISSFIAMIFFSYIIFNLSIYKKTPAIISILVIAFVWLEIGFVVLFIESIFEIYSLKLALHIFALGFVANLLIGFGSRVVMGHAIPAQRIVADKLTVYIFALTQVLVISRIVASLLFLSDSAVFMGFLHLSSWLWIVLFIVWSYRYAKILLRIKS